MLLPKALSVATPPKAQFLIMLAEALPMTMLAKALSVTTLPEQMYVTMRPRPCGSQAVACMLSCFYMQCTSTTSWQQPSFSHI